MSMRSAASMRPRRPDPEDETDASNLLWGRVKWFGGFNNYTGRENPYGFIESNGVEFFVHRSEVLSPSDRMIEGAEVLYRRAVDRRGKIAAKAVRIIALMSDDELVSVLKEGGHPPPDSVLKIVLRRKKIAPLLEDVLAAVAALRSAEPSSGLLRLFWQHFPPLTPSDPFFQLAPEQVQVRIYREHYAPLRQTLLGLLTNENAPPTSITAEDLYSSLDDKDRNLAALWADTEDDPIVSQMLSARAAEKAIARLYADAGATVEDVAVSQLERSQNDWITHDLLVDEKIPIDVKNSRRPMNSTHLYVEHTIPHFKVNRAGSDVRIAGVLSPYLRKRFIDNPGSAWFPIDDIVFLGETSRQEIDALIRKYRSPYFEVVRGNERMFPSWVFGYPERWFPGIRDQMLHAAEKCQTVPAGEWRYIGEVIPSLCAIGVPLPSQLKGRLSKPQVLFYEKLQCNLDGIPTVPSIFLTVLSDFVEATVEDRQNYSPSEYNEILFPTNDPSASSTSDVLSKQGSEFPLGAIDPLDLVAGLVKALETLWQNRFETALTGFSSFRFAGIGLLQARRKDEVEWTTILAYCGGTEFQRGDGGAVLRTEAGRPMPKGKCGFSPLIIGKHETCANCRKLVCHKCDFCSAECQSEAFEKLSRGGHSITRSHQQKNPTDSGGHGEAPPWELPPLEAYDDLR